MHYNEIFLNFTQHSSLCHMTEKIHRRGIFVAQQHSLKEIENNSISTRLHSAYFMKNPLTMNYRNESNQHFHDNFWSDITWASSLEWEKVANSQMKESNNPTLNCNIEINLVEYPDTRVSYYLTRYLTVNNKVNSWKIN